MCGGVVDLCRMIDEEMREELFKDHLVEEEKEAMGIIVEHFSSGR
jgi:hypothetical protein